MDGTNTFNDIVIMFLIVEKLISKQKCVMKKREIIHCFKPLDTIINCNGNFKIVSEGLFT